MDRNEKFLKTLSVHEFKVISEVILLLYTTTLATLDIKKRKGHKSLYRVRVGTMRIIFSNDKKTGTISILEIARRSDTTYREY